jgi:hypothetical protein
MRNFRFVLMEIEFRPVLQSMVFLFSCISQRLRIQGDGQAKNEWNPKTERKTMLRRDIRINV